MSLLSDLSELVHQTFAEQGLETRFGEVVVSQRPDLCQFQCNGALAAAKASGKNPRELAQSIQAAINADPRLEKVEVAGPGFLNITVTDQYLSEQIQAVATNGFSLLSGEKKNVLIDYGGGNIAKSLHVGHLRTALIGESLKRMYTFAGHSTLGDYHLGDWGLPMGQLIAAMEEQYPDLPYFSDPSPEGYPEESPVTIEDLEELYPQASARCKTDEPFADKARQATVALQKGNPGYLALWTHFRDVSVAAMTEIYKKLDVHFDLWLGEASVSTRAEKIAEDLKGRGLTETSDGALIIPIAKPEDKKELPPLMLLTSRGGLTYGTTDLATVDERVQDFAIEKIVYAVDNRQSLHFEQVFRAARVSGIAPDSVELIHAANGTVNNADGKPMKTREGNLPRLVDLVNESQTFAKKQLDENNLAQDFTPEDREALTTMVGLAALVYGELSNHRTTNYSFDLERFTQIKGQTGPYLQYVAVRARSALKKAAEKQYFPGSFIEPQHEAERNLVLLLLQLPEILERALDLHAPNVVAEYTYEVASSFNKFYDNCHILSEQDEATRASWLALVQQTATCLEKLLHLLCIPIPERM